MVHDVIFSKLNLSKEMVLDEVALLSAYQRKSELDMDVEYFERKYNTTFEIFDQQIKTSNGSFEKEEDWMAWKFAVEGSAYWKNLLKEIRV